jgi:hypothetical protein
MIALARPEKKQPRRTGGERRAARNLVMVRSNANLT